VLLGFRIFVISLREGRASPIHSHAAWLCLDSSASTPAAGGLFPTPRVALSSERPLAASSSPRDREPETVSLQLPTGRLSH